MHLFAGKDPIETVGCLVKVGGHPRSLSVGNEAENTFSMRKPSQ